MKTLLEKAKEIESKRMPSVITEEKYDLAIAWAKGEISLRQIQKVLGYKNVNASYVFLANCFKHSILKTNMK
jgi:hypothetical protein